MKICSIQLLLLQAAAAAAAKLPNGTFPAMAMLRSGLIFGFPTHLPGAPGPVNKFLGIPYADKPVRFALSQPPAKWIIPKRTTSFGKSCYQLAVTNAVGPTQMLLDDLLNTHPEMSEDCLFINAFAPALTGPYGGRPVVLFIHGGGWSLGNGNFDLSGFAAYEDIVAFTINYRTNIFGFPNAGDIPVQQRNLGMFDQQLALQWIHDNARAFGGDPSKVTIWGESAGSISIDHFMHSYVNVKKPPFRAGIMSSGEGSFGEYGLAANPNDTSSWDSIAKIAGCSGNKVQCLQQLSPEALLDATIQSQAGFRPILDDKAVRLNRASAWREGNLALVPLLAGTLAQEGRDLVNPNVSLDLFNQYFLPESLATQEQKDAVYSYYKTLPNLNSDYDVASQIFGDLLFQCPLRKLTNISASLKNPTWRYYYNISMSDMLPAENQFLGKFHDSDIMSLFLSPTYEGLSPAGLPFPPVLSTFLKYWRGAIGKFVRNPLAGPGWPAVGSQYAPFDIASQGDLGDVHSSGATPVNQTEVDANCEVWWGVLDTIEKVIG
ncbi:hypothetical protein E4U41_005087 [Claviceps citrina]|nr:hypothetical protein E4U41_005087 [Claviceps citrina]